MNTNRPFVPKGAIYKDEADKIRQEARNGAIQADFMFTVAEGWKPDSRVSPDLLLKLQSLAINQIFRCAGHFRDDKVILNGATHQPPDWQNVPPLVEEMCGYINDRWADKTAFHLSAYAMWRLNWIHPFFGGNGRTSRAFSYLILCAKLGFVPPAPDKSIPELIVANRRPYYEALRSADRQWESGVLDVSALEALLSDLLAEQLLGIHLKASGKANAKD